MIDGLEADVVTFNQVTDLNALVEARLVSKDWRTKYPYDASPCRSIWLYCSARQSELINPEKAFGGWDKIQQTIFGDGGAFDQIYIR